MVDPTTMAFLQVALAVSVTLDIIILFYALRLLALFRRAVIQRSWQMVLVSAVMFAIGSVGVAYSGTQASLLYMGIIFNILGLAFLGLALHFAYYFWRPKPRSVAERSRDIPA